MVHVQIIWHIVQENDSTKCRTFHSLTGWLFVTSPARPIVAKKWFNQNNVDAYIFVYAGLTHGGARRLQVRRNKYHRFEACGPRQWKGLLWLTNNIFKLIKFCSNSKSIVCLLHKKSKKKNDKTVEKTPQKATIIRIIL